MTDATEEMTVTAEGLRPGQLYEVHNRGRRAASMVLMVKVHSINDKVIQYAAVGSEEILEVSPERFLEIINYRR